MADLSKTSEIRGAFGQLMKQEVLEEYQTASIVRAIAQQVQLNGQGKAIVVKVLDEEQDVAMSDYVPYGDNEFGRARCETIELVPDQQKFVGIDFDSVEFAMTNVNVREAKIRIEANRMALALDNHVLGKIREAEGIQKVAVALTKENIYAQINDAVRKLDAAEVPAQGRVILMNWKTLSMLEQSPEFVGNFHVATEQRGLVDIQVSGCQVRVSNLLQDGEILVMHHDAVAIVDLIEKQAVGEHEKNFTAYYKALFVFGAEVLRPASIVRVAQA
jgi:hypothetical protein